MASGVPLLPGRARYDLLQSSSTWFIHKMATGSSLDGTAPQRTGEDESQTDPTFVKAGRASFEELTHGGLFTLPGNYKKPIVVEAILNAGTATLSIVRLDDPAVTRAVPGTFPFRMTPGEYLKATGGAVSGYDK